MIINTSCSLQNVYVARWCDAQDSAVSVLEWDTTNKGNKYMVDNPFLVRTPSTTVVDMQGHLNKLMPYNGTSRTYS